MLLLKLLVICHALTRLFCLLFVVKQNQKGVSLWWGSYMSSVLLEKHQ